MKMSNEIEHEQRRVMGNCICALIYSRIVSNCRRKEAEKRQKKINIVAVGCDYLVLETKLKWMGHWTICATYSFMYYWTFMTPPKTVNIAWSILPNSQHKRTHTRSKLIFFSAFSHSSLYPLNVVLNTVVCGAERERSKCKWLKWNEKLTFEVDTCDVRG